MKAFAAGSFHRVWRVFHWICASLGILVILVMFTPLVPWWAHRLAGSFDDPHGDVLIVLGAAHGSDGALSYSSYLRCSYAIRAYREGWVRMIVLTGNDKDPSGAPLKDFMMANGVPAAVILVESASRSTRENALFSEPLLEKIPGVRILLTSDYHMYRAARVFRKAGIPVVPRPIPDAYKRGTNFFNRWSAFGDLCQETVKIAYYQARGWM